MNSPSPGSPEWLDQVEEEVLDPDRPIIDPHHHLWRDRRGRPYLLEDLRGDTDSGHNVAKTVFVECGASYRREGPDSLKPVGETEFVARIAAASAAKNPGAATISGIVAHADLRLGREVAKVLDAHEEAGNGLFRGIRHSGARDPEPEALSIPGRAEEGLWENPAFRAGLQILGDRGLVFDSWHYHHQLPAFADLVRSAPGTTIVLDHFGTPLGVGLYADRRQEIFETWKKDIAAVAESPNVVAKLGGLAMPDNGFGWNRRTRPASSDELVAAQKPYYLHTIDCFGPDRCMFESNFPVDKRSISYAVLWNAFKKIAEGFSDSEKHLMFYATAQRVYRL